MYTTPLNINNQHSPNTCKALHQTKWFAPPPFINPTPPPHPTPMGIGQNLTRPVNRCFYFRTIQTIVCKNVLENILSLIPRLLSPPPISNVDYLDSTTLCNTKITIFNIDMGEGGKNSSHLTEKP